MRYREQCPPYANTHIHTYTHTNKHTYEQENFQYFYNDDPSIFFRTSKLLIKKQYCAYSTYNEREGFSFGCTRSTHTHPYTLPPTHTTYTDQIQYIYEMILQRFGSALYAGVKLCSDSATNTHTYTTDTPHTHTDIHMLFT